MPILDITIILRESEALPQGMTSALADAAAHVFQSDPGRTWVELRTLEPDRYAEDSGGPPGGVHPVFVSVLKAKLGDRSELEVEALELARSLSDVLARPTENIHILYEPSATGRAAFGGKLLLP